MIKRERERKWKKVRVDRDIKEILIKYREEIRWKSVKLEREIEWEVLYRENKVQLYRRREKDRKKNEEMNVINKFKKERLWNSDSLYK